MLFRHKSIVNLAMAVYRKFCKLWDFVSFSFTTKKQDSESMVNLFPLIKDYLVDKDDRIRQFITWFQNLVMEEEALLQAGAQRYERTHSRKASINH